MAETRASKSKGMKLDVIISKLKINPPQEAYDAQNQTSKPTDTKETEKTNDKIDNVEVQAEGRKSKRKSQRIVRYRIEGDDGCDDNDEQQTVTEETTQEDKNKTTENDVQLPETIFEELPNGEAATFEEDEDTTVLFLPADEIQVKTGPCDDYLENLLDGNEDSHHEEESGDEKGSERKKKKKKSKHYESDESLDEDGLPRRVICTACGRKVNPSHGTILRHPILNVLVCKKCNQYYNSGPFTRDEFGMEEQCRWCGDGGDLICCDMCEKVFCKPCLQRNCGKTYLKNLLNAPDDYKWLCIVCNKDKPTKHIQRIRKKCEQVMEALERVKAQKAHFKSKKGQQPSVVVGPTTSERRNRLNCLSEGIKSEGFSSSGESPIKKNFSKDAELPVKLFNKDEDDKEEESEKEKENKSETKSENEQEDDQSEGDEGVRTRRRLSLRTKKVDSEESKKPKENRKEKEEEVEEEEKEVEQEQDNEETSEKPKTRSQKRKSKEKDTTATNDTLLSKDKNKKDAAQDSEEDENDSKTKAKMDVTDEEENTEEIRVTRSGKVIGEKKMKEASQESVEETEIEPENTDAGKEEEDGEVRTTRSGKVLGNKTKETTKESDEVTGNESKDEDTDKEENAERIKCSGKAKGTELDKKVMKVTANSGNSETQEKLLTKKKNKKVNRTPQGSDENESSDRNSDKAINKKEKVVDRIKQEIINDEQDSSDCASVKRLSRKSKDKANKLIQRQDEKKDKKASEPKVIVIDSSDENSGNESLKDKEIEKKRSKDLKNNQKEKRNNDNKDSNRRKTKNADVKKVKKEAKESSSSSTSDSGPKLKKRKNKTSSTRQTVKGKRSTKRDLKGEQETDSSESSESEDSHQKPKHSKNKRTTTEEMSSDSDFQTQKISKKKTVNKKQQKLDSSDSDKDLASMVKRKNAKEEHDDYSVEEEEHDDYSIEESSESDENSSESEQDSESDSKAKTRRSRGLQKQTRKRPRPVASSSDSEESSEKSSDDEGVARRTRKRKLIESDSSNEDDQKPKNLKNKRLKKTRKVAKGKKGKKKRNALDSDEEDENDTEDSSESEPEPKSRSKKTKNQKKKGKKTTKKKKRGRIRKNADSDDDDEEEETSPRKGRKKIRKLLTDENLGEETRKARRLEEERRKRLLERTRTAENEEVPAESWHINTIVLEKDKETKEPKVEVHADLVQHLKPHQAKGIQFMYDNVVDSVEAYKKGDKGGGCILAHCMGLGKTLQVVALIHTLHNHKEFDFKTTLIIAPLNTVLNWQVEFDKWLSVDERMEVFVLKEAGPNKWRRADMLQQWQRYGGVMIMGYDMYRNLSLCNRTRSKFQKKIFKESLVEPGPDLVVCDEGHILRNDQSAISKCVNAITTRRRIVLTGTPLQNNLIEYHCMLSFVKPNLLGTRKEFMNLFGNPILNGQCFDSSPLDVKLMKQSCHVLYKLLEGCVQRRDYSVLTPFLPPKHEYVIKVRLSEKQRKLYDHYLKTFVYPDGSLDRRGASLFSDYQALMRIWTHPWCLKLEAIRRSLRAPYSDSDNSLDGFVVHTDEEEESESLSSSEEISLASDDSLPKRRQNGNNSKNGEVFELKSSSDEESNDDHNTSDEEVMPQPSSRLKVDKVEENGEGESNTRSGALFKGDEPPEEKEWYDEFLADEDEYNVELSGKMAMLLEILADAEAVEEKVLVFSQSLVTLDLIERALGGGEVGGDRENWCRGCDYFRMDGSTTVQIRQRWADIFNDVDNKTARLFLISTKAGGLGINLVAANRVVVFDVSWNPSHDVQSIFRVFRFGQTKPVYVYRLVAEGVMEERIYDRQIAKLSTSQRVIDKHQVERHFTAADLAELYRFNPSIYDEEKDKENTPTLPLPKDAVLADLINRLHPKWIVKYHEHDSLLQNVQDEHLTDEECKQAWAAYEAQKNQSRNNFSMRALQEQYAQQQLQQQQLATPSQTTAHYSNAVLREMQQLQHQQLQMARIQSPMHLPPNQQYMPSPGSQTVAQQIRNERLRHQLLQHIGAARPIYQQAGPGGATYQPMMNYISQQQQQQQQQAHHLLRAPRPQAPNPRHQAPVVPVIRPGTQYRM